MYVNTLYPQAIYDFQPFDPALLWIVILSFVIAFFLAFGVGANDVANSFGTSVGSGVLSLRTACLLATFFEILGAIMMGYRVSETIRTGMIFVEQYDGQVKLLMFGYLSALIGGCIWNLVATLFGMPVSGTHSIVGAIIGFAVVAKGWGGVRWQGLGTIVASWFISPLLSGFVSCLLWFLIQKGIVEKDNSLKNGLIALPFFYAATVFINIFSITHEGPHFFKNFNWWIALLAASGCALVTGLIVWFWYVPRKRSEILKSLGAIKDQGPESQVNGKSNQFEMIENGKTIAPTPIKIDGTENEEGNNNNNGHIYINGAVNRSNSYKQATGEKMQTEVVVSSNGSSPKVKTLRSNSNVSAKIGVVDANELDKEAGGKQVPILDEEDKPEVAQLFTYLQILTACFGSFAHGGNDVSNAIGPLVAVMMLFKDGHQGNETDWYILLYGGVGISVGLWIWGRRVIKTMGTDLTKITPSSGFTIEIGAAATVLLASKIGLPVSTTHCKVGSVVIVGKARGGTTGVNWKLFGSISIAWILTLPFTALFSAAAMFILKMFV